MPRFTLAEDDNDYDNDAAAATPEMRRKSNRSSFGTMASRFGGGGSSSTFASPPPRTTLRWGTAATSSSTSTPPTMRAPSRTSAATTTMSSSLRLACASPDGKAWYSLTKEAATGNYSLVTQQSSIGNDNVITTALPSAVQALLRTDAPLELLCLDDGDGYETTTTTATNSDNDTAAAPKTSFWPRLCLYASRNLFVLQITAHDGDNKTKMTCTPLLEEWLLPKPSNRLVRVRAAPQRCTGHAYYAPLGSCAVLLHCGGNDYKFITFTIDKNDNSVTNMRIPLVMTTTSGNDDKLVDFDFGRARGPLTLLASMTAVFLSQAGDVSVANPILWPNSVVPKTSYESALDTLQALLARLDRTAPRRRQVLAATRYLRDVFHRTAANPRNQLVQAVLKDTEAAAWPTAFQANILHTSTEVNSGAAAASSLVTLPADQDWMALALGRPAGGWVEWAILHPAACALPLFTFCPLQDRMAIGNLAAQQAQWVERVQFQMTPASDLLLLPTSETVLHVVVPHAVYSVSTNAFMVAARQLRAAAVADIGVEVPATRTTAWAAVSAPSANIIGATTWMERKDALSVRLADGTATTVHVTQQLYRHELTTLFPESSSVPRITTNAATDPMDLQNTPPYAATIQPLLQQISAGLANMSKVVGSQTMYQDLTPELFAYALDLKERCETQVSMPLLELSQLTKVRKNALKAMIVTQQDKLNDLLQQQQDLDVARTSMLQRAAQAAANIQVLRTRAARMRETLVATAPTMTTAERDFCEQMQRTQSKVEYWDGRAQGLLQKMQHETAALEQQQQQDAPPPDYASNLTAEQWQQVDTLGQLSDKLLLKTRADMHAVDKRVRALAETVGASRGDASKM